MACNDRDGGDENETKEASSPLKGQEEAGGKVQKDHDERWRLFDEHSQRRNLWELGGWPRELPLQYGGGLPAPLDVLGAIGNDRLAGLPRHVPSVVTSAVSAAGDSFRGGWHEKEDPETRKIRERKG
jgi:hypothetical protein